MIRPTRHLTALLIATLVAVSALAVHAQDDGVDDFPTMEQDARDLLGDRAQPPDLSDDMPTGVQEGDNAGTANFSIPAEDTTETVTRSSEHSSSFSIGIGDDDDRDDQRRAPGEIANNPPPPPGWPGSRHANRPGGGHGPVTQLSPGPIWNNNDAQGKCPNLCASNDLVWTGDWRTVGFNKSTCDCAQSVAAPSPAYGPGTYCEAKPNYQCRGCSVHCSGNQTAHCTQGDRGIFNRPDSVNCGTDAVCECR